MADTLSAITRIYFNGLGVIEGFVPTPVPTEWLG